MTAQPCVPDIGLRDAPALRWGVAGPGGIAADFVSTVQRHTDQQVAAVASRSAARAQEFGARFDVPATYDSYDALVDSDVDVVYVASVNATHVDIALRAVAAGKHVLVEKPLATSAADARRLADAARSAGVLVMEALWTRYVPTYVELARQLAAGAVGDPRVASVTVGWRAHDGRLWDPPEQGGGVTLDMGVYGLWFAQFAVGRPVHVSASVQAVDGVDTSAVVALAAADGRLASVATTLWNDTSGHAEIIGTEGTAVVTDHVVFPSGFCVSGPSGRHEWRDESGLSGRDGLAWQAAALAAYVAEGRTDSPVHSLADSVALAETMDLVLRARTP
ncbi:putative dehydrogenase [Motilibacter peucedani]|uniref:Putative dehydrogenase n=1 Tax=Motilibacter peucedani TaxID=598650 RepID=A0A420XMC2_9ACTN|nr:Gfo/Idh/MocA family oxidoreductase [Motilibacter peucedani]RKS72433.1 putative dehydrogenase [Motilibacter peucedani]